MDIKVTAGTSGSPMDDTFLIRKTPFAPRVFIPCRWSSAKSLNETLVPSQRFQRGQHHSLSQSLQMDVRPAVWKKGGTHSFKNVLWLQNQRVPPHSQDPSSSAPANCCAHFYVFSTRYSQRDVPAHATWHQITCWWSSLLVLGLQCGLHPEWSWEGWCWHQSHQAWEGSSPGDAFHPRLCCLSLSLGLSTARDQDLSVPEDWTRTRATETEASDMEPSSH